MLVSPDNIDLASNFSVNVSSTEVDAAFYRTPCNATTLQPLPQHSFPTFNPREPSTQPLNYKDYDNPLYTVNGVLHYQCNVSSSASATNGTCGAEISLFNNVTYYTQSKNGEIDVDEFASKRECLEARPNGSSVVTNIMFKLQEPSFYYVTVRADVGYKVDCVANGSISLYDSKGLIADHCSLGSTTTWCRFNISDNASSYSQTDMNCILARSNALKSLTLASNTTLVDAEVKSVKKNLFSVSLFVSSVAFVTIGGCLSVVCIIALYKTNRNSRNLNHT